MTAALAETPVAGSPVLTLVDVPTDDAQLSVEDAQLSVEDLGSRIVGLAGRLAATTCQWLLLVAAFDARDGCARFGLASTARWLTHCCGLSHRAAVEHVRVARALVAFPALADAMSAGRVSYSHVRAIARVPRESGAEPESSGAGDERAVADLIEVAESGTVGQLETVVRGLRTVEDIETTDAAAQKPEQYVRTSWSESSQWRLAARLDPERGAVVDSALDALAAAEGLTRVEALERMAEIALVVVRDSGRARDLRGDERAAVVVHLDATVAGSQARGTAAPQPASDVRPPVDRQPSAGGMPDSPAGPAIGRWTARVQDGPGLPHSVVHRLLCDGRFRTALHDTDGTMLDLGRSSRVVSRKLFRALMHRDGGRCVHPGCESTAGIEAHHVRHWIDGGPTDQANLVLLCRRHHHRHHDGDFTIAPERGGTFAFRRADGRALERHVDPSRLLPSAPKNRQATGRAPRWTGTGQRLDRHYAISVLAQRRRREIDDAAPAGNGPPA